MVEFIEETEKGSLDGQGEYELIAPIEFTGMTLEQRWAAVKTFIDTGQLPGEDVIDDPGEGLEIPQIDIDLSELSQRDLLQSLVEFQQVQSNTMVSMLSTLIDIFASVRGNRTITIIGAEAIDQQDIPEEVISQSSPQDSVLTRTLWLRASNDNNAPVAFGDDQVDPDRAFVLNKGEVIKLDIDIGRIDLYMASETAGQEIQIMGLR